jgi:hypothetical protein
MALQNLKVQFMEAEASEKATARGIILITLFALVLCLGATCGSGTRA